MKVDKRFDKKLTKEELFKEVASLLKNCIIDGNIVFIQRSNVETQVRDLLYEIFGRMGIYYSQGYDGFVFDDDPFDMIEKFSDGKYQYYMDTPKWIADIMIQNLDIKAEDKILNPCAGRGGLSKAIRHSNALCDITAVEISTSFYQSLKIVAENNNITTKRMNFIRFNSQFKFDKIIIHPPINNIIYTDVVMRAYELLEDYGTLITILPGESKRAQKKKNTFEKRFWRWFYKVGGDIFQEIPSGTFCPEKRISKYDGSGAIGIIYKMPW